jgi:hypothetical protein
MTDPLEPVDMTETDQLVEPTGNGPQPDDPDVQPAQDPNAIPDGSVTEHDV